MSPRARGPLERLPHAIAEQVVRRLVELLDVDEIVRRVDVDDVVRRVDVNEVVARVDVNEVVGRVDVDALLDRVDPDALLDRVDVDRLVRRVDVDALAARIDVNALAERIDVEELLRRADLAGIVAQSTTGMLGEFVQLLRRQVVTLDDVVDALTLRSRRAAADKGPPALLEAASHLRHPNREGQYAGAVTRLLALLADVAAGWGLFALLATGLDAAAGLLTGHSFSLFHERVAGAVVAVLWGFCYFSVGWGLTGRTVGMAVLGARVVTVDGRRPNARAAMVRTLVLPVSIAIVGLGLLGVLVRGDRRALHDVAAGTCVVYSWEARGDAPHHAAPVGSGVP